MSDELCHSCPRRGECLLADSATAIDRCTYHQRAREAIRFAAAAGRHLE